VAKLPRLAAYLASVSIGGHALAGVQRRHARRAMFSYLLGAFEVFLCLALDGATGSCSSIRSRARRASVRGCAAREKMAGRR